MNIGFKFVLIIATLGTAITLLTMVTPSMAAKDQGTPYMVQNTSKSSQDPLPGLNYIKL